MKNFQFTNNEDFNRFELKINNTTAIVEYILTPQGVVFMTHTEIPNSLESDEVIPVLMEDSLQEIKRKEHVVFPMCPVAQEYIKAHPEWNTLVE